MTSRASTALTLLTLEHLQEVKRQTDPDLLVLETDNVLFKDEGFR